MTGDKTVFKAYNGKEVVVNGCKIEFSFYGHCGASYVCPNHTAAKELARTIADFASGCVEDYADDHKYDCMGEDC